MELTPCLMRSTRTIWLCSLISEIIVTLLCRHLLSILQRNTVPVMIGNAGKLEYFPHICVMRVFPHPTQTTSLVFQSHLASIKCKGPAPSYLEARSSRFSRCVDHDPTRPSRPFSVIDMDWACYRSLAPSLSTNHTLSSAWFGCGPELVSGTCAL